MRGLGHRPLDFIRRVLFIEDPHPGVLQAMFVTLYVIDLVLRWAAGSSLGAGPLAGLVLVLVVGLFAALTPWSSLPTWVVACVPILDMAALGLARLDSAGAGADLLVVLPALWLGRKFGTRGARTAVLSALVLIVLPGLLYLGTDSANVSRSVLLVCVVAWAALAISSAIQRSQANRDVAERGRLELASALATIEEERSFSRAILDTVDVGLVLLDADGTYRTMNRRHESFMRIGYPDGHAGRAGQVGQVFDVDGRTPLVREQMPTYRASRGEEFDDLRLWIGSDPATMRALSVSARSVRSDDGSFAGAALGYTDVTDFMQALRVKDEFVALVSHELRTPLTSIVGYVQLLEEDPSLPPQALDQLAVVHRNAERLRRLIADLLDTAQRDGAPMPINRARCDLRGLVEESVEAARPAADAAGIGLELSVVPLEMSVDPQRIAQAVDNLVSNAIKYTEKGGRVRVRLAVESGRAALEVADTGIGITPADVERLFTRFFRTRDAERRAVAGAGLGLSITKDIVESHGGGIEVESVPGEGSVFRVWLPVLTVATDD